jgi:hypothetical protein
MSKVLSSIMFVVLLSLPSLSLALTGPTKIYGPWFNSYLNPSATTGMVADTGITLSNVNNTQATVNITYYDNITGQPITYNSASVFTHVIPANDWTVVQVANDIHQDHFGNFIITVVEGYITADEYNTVYVDGVQRAGYPIQTQTTTASVLTLDSYTQTSDGSADTYIALNNSEETSATVNIKFYPSGGGGIVPSPDGATVTLLPHQNYVFSPQAYGLSGPNMSNAARGTARITVSDGSIIGYGEYFEPTPTFLKVGEASLHKLPFTR